MTPLPAFDANRPLTVQKLLKRRQQAANHGMIRYRSSTWKEGASMENLGLLFAIIDLFWWLRK